eukprot:s905_g3.t1
MESARSEVDAFLIQEFHPSRRPDDVQSEVAFRRIAAASEVLGDVDGTFLYDVARVGVPIGVGVELPRVPDVFEPKVKWNPSEAEGEFVDTKAENYSSAVESMAQIKEQIEADLKKGFVSRMSRSEAESRYHGRLAVAALGAVPKDLESGEVRVVHDGSFSVDVNHRIRVRDRLRDPLVDDAEAVIRQVKSEDADRPGIRCCHLLAGLEWAVYHLLYSDDGLLVARGSKFGYKCLFWLFLFDLFEVPLSWRKLRGGVYLQSIGYQICLSSYQIGISERKRDWIAAWVRTTLQRGGITGRDLKSGLGRLVFVAGALRHVRPFLGVLFAWSSVLAAGTCAAFPLGVRLVLELIAQEVAGTRMADVCEWPRYPVDCFRIDAKAEKDEIGYSAVGVCEGAKGEPFRVIAALELTAVLVASILFSKFGSLKGLFAACALPALTDSKVPAHVVDKYLSCSFPLSVILMEVSLQLQRMNTRLMLRWIPRDQNIEADALTNQNCHGFLSANRIQVDFDALDFAILPRLMEAAQAVDSEVRLKKSKREVNGMNGSAFTEPARRRRKGETRWKDPW